MTGELGAGCSAGPSLKAALKPFQRPVLPKPICISDFGSLVMAHVAHLLPGLLLPGLCLHLLHLQRVSLPPPHEEVVVPNAQLKNLLQSGVKSREIQLYA